MHLQLQPPGKTPLLVRSNRLLLLPFLIRPFLRTAPTKYLRLLPRVLSVRVPFPKVSSEAQHLIGKAVSKSPSPDPGTDFSLAKDNEEDVSQQANAPGSALQEQQVSAADYDPSQDRREEEKRHLGIKEEPDIQEVPEEIVVEESDDDDLDDMFSVAAEDKPKKVKKTKRVAVSFFISFL